jgi:hypothetical protein
MPHRSAAELVATLAEAVEHAHRRGVLHRDLKPANILLQEDLSPRRKDAKKDQEEKGQGDQSSSSLPSSLVSLRLGERSSFVPKITDFGLAKLLESDTPGRSQSGAIVGTPSYMAPEQADGVKRTLGPTADVHALGAILYELLTGRPPFQGETVLETLLLVRSADPVPPRRLRPGLPPDLDTICLKCLHKEPAKRYGSAQALAEDLQRFLNGQPIQARATPLWKRAWKWAQQRLAEDQRDLAVLVAKQGSAEEARRLVEQALGHARTPRTLAPGVEGPQKEMETVSAVRADILLTCGDHGEAARAAVELPSLFRDAGVGFRSAGALLARCAALASEDGNLPPGERQGQAEGYAGQAVSLLREALQRGAVVRNAL